MLCTFGIHLRPARIVAYAVVLASSLAGAALAVAAGCGGSVLSDSYIKEMTGAQYSAALDDLERRKVDVTASLQRTESDLKKMQMFELYRKMGYGMRTAGGPCAGQAEVALDTYARRKAQIDAGRDASELTASYRDRKREYETCMDGAIRADAYFRKLLDEDADAAILARRQGAERYSFATANGRYEALKAELLPQDAKNLGNNFIRRAIVDLRVRRSDLSEELACLSSAKDNLLMTVLRRALPDPRY